MIRVLIAVLLLAASGIPRSEAQTAPPDISTQAPLKMTTYVVGVIRKGPNWGTGTVAEREKIQEGHMANIRRMASLGKLIVAGPIDDGMLRGLFIFGLSSTEEARTLVGPDPAVASGRLIVDYYPWYAAAGIKVEQAAITPDSTQEKVIPIITRIQQADYEADQAALQRLYGELAPYAVPGPHAAQIFYWRGFAQWRRAVNGFNDHVDTAELKIDLQLAASEFESALQANSDFVDARIGELSCVTLLAFAVNENNPALVQDLVRKAQQLRKEAFAAAPENPRLLWVDGATLWYTPVERGGGQAKALAAYQQGLESIRKLRTAPSDPLDPAWGEPELLMNLAWSNLNRLNPDLHAAETFALQALKIVPNWHYVRDILLPQIRNAKTRASLDL